MNDIALRKLQHFCAYQERCHEEVRTKLLALKIYGSELEEIINKLIEDDFLNEERFALAYAGGKFRMKQWGRNRIVNELKRRKISEYCIRKALKEIPDDEYQNVLRRLTGKTLTRYNKTEPRTAKNKTAQYLIAKGYEPELVWSLLNSKGE